MVKIVSIEGMSCGHCKMHVEKALIAVPGVTAAVVDLKAGNARVTLSAPVADETLTQAVEDAGYEATAVGDA